MSGSAVRTPAVDASTGEWSPRLEHDVIVSAAESVLRQTRAWELRLISCEFYEGVLILRGRVRSYYLKQLAQELVRSVESVQQVDNRLQVVCS